MRDCPGDQSHAARVRHRLAATCACVCLTAPAACTDGTDVEAGTPTATATPVAAADVPHDATVWVQATPAEQGLRLRQWGSADVDVDVATLSGGVLTAPDTDEPGGAGYVLRYPTYTDDTDYPRAVLVVNNADPEDIDAPDDDPLNPGDADFSFGADFTLDETSTGRDDDNGNNLIQRGISSYPALFKLEVDADDRPACTVRGTEGTVIVRSLRTVLPHVWYRVSCRRQGEDVTVSVGEVLTDGSTVLVSRTVSGPTGAVAQEDPQVPLSVGGKVDSGDRVIASASDQFNGEVANPWLLVSRPS